MTIVDDYINYTSNYKKEYGNSTVVLMQVGSFFEMYGTNKEGANVEEICNIINIQVTRKNKSIEEISRKNPMMCGIPLYMLKKYVDILINENYTLIIIEQVTPPPEPKREVTNIISPSTYVDNDTVPVNNYLMSLYITTGYNKNNEYLTAACSWIDVNTNKNYIYEVPYVIQDTLMCLEDINRIILANKPKEIIVFTDFACRKVKGLNLVNTFIKNLDIPCVHNRLDSTLNENFLKVGYQNTVLKKVYPNTGMLSPIEYLDLETRPISIIAFIYNIQFIYDHNENIIGGLDKPIFVEKKKTLSLINNCIENLDIISRTKKGKNSSLESILNNCLTPIGKRYFRHCLLNPLLDKEEIYYRYDMIDFFINENFYKSVKPHLSKISDIERLFKRLILKKLEPSEFVMIDSSLKSVNDLFSILNDWSKDEHTKLLELIKFHDTKFNLLEMSSVNLTQITKNIFKVGTYPEIDDLQQKILSLENIFENICNCLNENKIDSEFKLDITSKNERKITITKKRFDTLLKDENRIKRIDRLLKNYNLTFNDMESRPISSAKDAAIRITFKNMSDSQTYLQELQSDFKRQIIEKYYLELEYIYKEYEQFFKNIISFISKVDFFYTCAKNAVDKCYKRPILGESSSFINTFNIRHPIIEHINTDIPYIGNDIHISNGGILLYGLNAVGKSSFMKSIAINLIMAQAGMYVAADSFEYYPYENIFTRIPGGDNLFKNQSTFVAEISELRTILKRADNRSLIIGDELCSGTETVSAISLVTSGINYLSKIGCSFIFATHLHEITELDCIKSLKNVDIYHLSVKYDNENDCLVYNRKLTKGNGNTLYGLEVAKSLDLPLDFLNFANAVRKEYIKENKEFVKTKTSAYCSDVFMDMCSICKKECEEVHHIKEQHTANKNNIIETEHIHKNRKSNLITLCSECHDKIHYDNLKINGYVQTSKGVALDVEEKNKKINCDIDKRIKDLRAEGKSFNFIFQTIKKVDEKITLYRIMKICKK